LVITNSLVPFKVILMAKLFDFGLITQAKRYCYILRSAVEKYILMRSQYQVDTYWMNVNWKVVVCVLNEIESRMYGQEIRQQVDQEDEDNMNGISDPTSSSPEDVVDQIEENDQSPESPEDSERLISDVQSLRLDSTRPPSSTPTPTKTQVQPLFNCVESREPKLGLVSKTKEASEPPSPEKIIQPPPPPPATNKYNFFIPPPIVQSSDPVPDFISSGISTEKPDEESAPFNQNEVTKPPSFNSTFNPVNAQPAGFPPALSPILSPSSNLEPYSVKESKIEPSQNIPSTGREDENKNKNQEQQEERAKPKGFMTSLMSRLPAFKNNTAHLPDDKDPSIVWDANTGRWVDKNAQNDAGIDPQVMNGPPKMPFSNPTSTPQLQTNLDPSQFQFVKKKQKRYVDLWQQTQQQQQQMHKTS